MTENVDLFLQLAKTQKVDLLIMDISLANSRYRGKEVDGVAITRLLKKIR